MKAYASIIPESDLKKKKMKKPDNELSNAVKRYSLRNQIMKVNSCHKEKKMRNGT